MGNCWACVPQGDVYIIERFGKFNKVANPGFHCVCPCVGDHVRGAVSLRVRQLDVRCETKTKDNVFVAIVLSCQYQVLPDSIVDSFYKLTDQTAQIRAYVFDVVRSTVPKMDLDDVFTLKEEIARDVRTQLSKCMREFGFSILQTLVTDIEPAAKVKTAMNEINAASRMRAAAADKAEAHKITIVKAAEADAEAKYLAGQGIARQRQAIINGLRESVKAFEMEVDDISSKEVMELMLVTQYFDTIREIGAHGRSNTVFVPHQPGGLSDISSQIRSGFMQAAAGKERHA